MPTYPLDTLSPTVDATGVAAPLYPDILESLKASFRAIYGADAYLDPDSQDGQWLAIVAGAIHGANQAAIAAYNSFRPGGATGEGLSSIVKINGLARRAASYSTADVTLTGAAGTAVSGGVVEDQDGNKWSLPASVTIPLAGEITVTATAQRIGAVAAPAGAITRIYTPARGWQSATNAAAATPGAPVETDAELRRRQAQSVSLPASSTMASMWAGIAEVDGVTAVRGYENDTGSTDALGIPAHSFAFVVEGGDADAIAGEIAIRKGGAGTYGTISALWADQYGILAEIHFSRPAVVPIAVEIDIEALPGYVDATGAAAVQAVADAINAGGIGAGIYVSRLYTPANSGGSTYNVTAIRIARDAGTPGASDIALDFDELAACDIADIDLTVA